MFAFACAHLKTTHSNLTWALQVKYNKLLATKPKKHLSSPLMRKIIMSGEMLKLHQMVSFISSLNLKDESSHIVYF